MCIRDSGEIVQGIVCSKPPHFMKQSEKGKAIAFDDLLIDVGATSLKAVSYTHLLGPLYHHKFMISYKIRNMYMKVISNTVAS